MVTNRTVTGALAATAIVFAALSGYLFVAPPGGAGKTITNTTTQMSTELSTQLSTVYSTVATPVLSTITSTATSIFNTTTTLLSTLTTTSSTTVVSTTTSTATGPFTVNLAYKAGTGLYLTNASAFTLYFRATDPGNGTSTCTGSCVTTWPLFYSAGPITVPPGLSASSFGLATRTDGKMQTTYNGYPLYYYVNDKAAGQITGQGHGNFYPCCSIDATSSTSTTTTTTTTTTSTSATPAVVKVSIPSGTGSSSSLNYSPSTITVVIGTNNTIMWTNNDAAVHSVDSSSVPAGAQAFSDDNLTPGATYSVTLTVAGTYQYYCMFHSWMTGTIVVKP